MYVGFEQVAAGAAAKTVSDLTIPGNAIGAEIQADTQNVNYTCDGTAPTATAGMAFVTTMEPKFIRIEDLRRIKFIQNAVGVGNLNIHYVAGRDV